MSVAGGAIAIRGFNYQKAVISLIAVLHYNKEGFEIFIENQEDAEVILKDSHTFVQIKSSKLSLNDLKKIGAGNKSILGKNLSKNIEGARYKIVTVDTFASKDKKNLKNSDGNLLFDEAYKYSDDQIKIIIEALKDEGFEEEDLKNKLAASYLYFSPFKAVYKDASTFIKGKMNECGIKVDEKRGDTALKELTNQIDQRSEILPTLDNPYNPKKKLTAVDLKTIFIVSQDFQECVWNDIKSNFPLLDRLKIQNYLFTMMSSQRALKRTIERDFGNLSIDTNILPVLEESYQKIKNLGDKHLLYAILISIIADKIQEQVLCS